MSSINQVRFVSAVIIAVFSILMFEAVVDAQVVKNVRFAKGKYSASYRGNLPRNSTDYDAYVFRAKRGQTLTFKLTTAEPDAWVTVYETQDEIDPTEDIVPADIEHPRSWSGRLPVTSEYSVQVYGVRRHGGPSKRSAYAIEITIR